jgi:polyisoprenoid-binding protein YceI
MPAAVAVAAHSTPARGNAMRAIALLAGLLLAGSAAAAPLTYSFDKAHSQIHFSANHLGFSNSTGRVKISDGSIVFDPADWSTAKVDATIDIASLDFGDATWNEHMAAEKWFNSAKFPQARFVSTAIEKTGDNSGKVTGDLTLLGVTLPVTLAVTLNKSAEHPFSKKPALGFSATTEFARSPFGMKEYAGAIGEQVAVKLEIEAQAK